MKHFDVVIVGGGHAGVEAAHVAHRMGVSAAMVTHSFSTIGVMSCNPAIGGLGKGHLVREIDALDGLMGRAADAAGIQFRLLNRRKGPAVQGPRAQADRALYRSAIQNEIKAAARIHVIEGEVSDLILEKSVVGGVILADGSEVRADAVVVTTGTFLRGVVHIGDVSTPGGRIGHAPSEQLARRFDGFGLPLGRLKTGTPPRLDGRTINWDVLAEQPGDEHPEMFSFLSDGPMTRQVSCGLTQTNEETHHIIRSNLNRSALYGGRIDGVGPRYCPSIEDKVVRFSEKSAHQVFLEPEGLTDHTVYPNGISTSLPEEIQNRYVRSIRGLEIVKILQLGYAIEYDYVDPRALSPSLELIDVPGLFLAGQINGTTGYEEAAAQGLWAGLNAVRLTRGQPSIGVPRSEAYLGVMLDDLTTRGVTEPYRMFTSRAEYRLSLRADNADQRLTEKGWQLGCVGEDRWCAFSKKREALEAGLGCLRAASFSKAEAASIGVTIAGDGAKRSGADLLALPDVEVSDLARADPSLDGFDPKIATQLKRDEMYRQYIDRQEKDVAALQRDEAKPIPKEFDYHSVPGLSSEVKEKLLKARPETLGQAGRIEGITPAALTLLLLRLRQPVARRVS